MATFTLKQHVKAPVGRVFDLAADFPNCPKYISGIKKTEMLTPGPVRVGSRFKETRIMFKKEATEIMEVFAFDPPRGYTLGGTSCGCEFRSTFRFIPSAGGTDVELTFDFRPLTFMAKVIGFLFSFMIKSCAKETAKDLGDLAAAAEGRVPPSVSTAA